MTPGHFYCIVKYDSGFIVLDSLAPDNSAPLTIFPTFVGAVTGIATSPDLTYSTCPSSVTGIAYLVYKYEYGDKCTVVDISRNEPLTKPHAQVGQTLTCTDRGDSVECHINDTSPSQLGHSHVLHACQQPKQQTSTCNTNNQAQQRYVCDNGEIAVEHDVEHSNISPGTKHQNGKNTLTQHGYESKMSTRNVSSQNGNKMGKPIRKSQTPRKKQSVLKRKKMHNTRVTSQL